MSIYSIRTLVVEVKATAEIKYPSIMSLCLLMCLYSLPVCHEGQKSINRNTASEHRATITVRQSGTIVSAINR